MIEKLEFDGGQGFVWLQVQRKLNEVIDVLNGIMNTSMEAVALKANGYMDFPTGDIFHEAVEEDVKKNTTG